MGGENLDEMVETHELGGVSSPEVGIWEAIRNCAVNLADAAHLCALEGRTPASLRRRSSALCATQALNLTAHQTLHTSRPHRLL